MAKEQGSKLAKVNRKRLSGGRPTLAEAQELTDTILDVGTHHFLTYGYQETTFDRIARDAATSKGAVYSRYPEKVSLFSAICKRLITDLYQSDIIELDVDLPINLCLARQANALLNAALSPVPKTLYQMITNDAPRHPELVKSTLEVWEFYVSQMEAYFRGRIEMGLLSLRHPREAAERFTQMVFGPIHVALIHGRELPDAEERDRHVTGTVLMFLGGVARLELETA